VGWDLVEGLIGEIGKILIDKTRTPTFGRIIAFDNPELQLYPSIDISVPRYLDILLRIIFPFGKRHYPQPSTREEAKMKRIFLATAFIATAYFQCRRAS